MISATEVLLDTTVLVDDTIWAGGSGGQAVGGFEEEKHTLEEMLGISPRERKRLRASGVI